MSTQPPVTVTVHVTVLADTNQTGNDRMYAGLSTTADPGSRSESTNVRMNHQRVWQ